MLLQLEVFSFALLYVVEHFLPRLCRKLKRDPIAGRRRLGGEIQGGTRFVGGSPILDGRFVECPTESREPGTASTETPMGGFPVVPHKRAITKYPHGLVHC